MTEDEKDLLAALASTAGLTEDRMREILAVKYPALSLGDAIRKEAKSV